MYLIGYSNATAPQNVISEPLYNGNGLYLNRSTMVDGVKTVDQHGHGISIVFQEDNTNSLHVYIYYSPWRNTSSLFHFILLQIFF